MFRLFSRVSLLDQARLLFWGGLLLGAAILALFIGAWLINMADPYRMITEKLIHQMAEEPQRTARLNEYSTIAVQIRRSLPSENAATWANWLDHNNVTTPIDWMSFETNVRLVTNRVDTAVHKIAALDNDLEMVEVAKLLSRDFARLRYYDLDIGDDVLADLYQKSVIASRSLANMSEGLDSAATAVADVTTFPDVESVQKELLTAKNSATSTVAVEGGLYSWAIPQGAVTDFVHLADFVYWSIDSWQGFPASMKAIQQPIAKDVTWLDGFEQDYRIAKAVNDRWYFDTLRHLPRFVADFHQPLLVGVIGSLLLAIVGWMVALLERWYSLPVAANPDPYLVFLWPNGPQEYQTLPKADELTIGNIVIRRARVRYYLERIDDAFPVHLNGRIIRGAQTLNDGDVLQIDEMQTIFQLAA